MNTELTKALLIGLLAKLPASGPLDAHALRLHRDELRRIISTLDQVELDLVFGHNNDYSDLKPRTGAPNV